MSELWEPLTQRRKPKNTRQINNSMTIESCLISLSLRQGVNFELVNRSESRYCTDDWPIRAERSGGASGIVDFFFIPKNFPLFFLLRAMGEKEFVTEERLTPFGWRGFFYIFILVYWIQLSKAFYFAGVIHVGFHVRYTHHCGYILLGDLNRISARGRERDRKKLLPVSINMIGQRRTPLYATHYGSRIFTITFS